MAELLESRQFTNNADKRAVLELYKSTALAVLGTVEELSFTGMPLVVLTLIFEVGFFSLVVLQPNSRWPTEQGTVA